MDNPILNRVSPDDAPPSVVQLPGPVRAALFLLAGSAVMLVLYLARDLFLPVALSLVISLTLSPVVRFGTKRGAPPGLTASVLVFGLALAFLVGSATLSQPLVRWIDDAPQLAYELRYRLQSVLKGMEAVSEAGKQVQQLGQPNDPNVQEVVVREPGLLSTAADRVAGIGAAILVTFGLTLYLLAYSALFYEKVVRILPRLSDKKRALRIAYDVERIVSRYLFTITLINVVLGTVIGLAMWVLGMPNPVLWGIAAALLNFLPYIGSAVGVLIAAAVAFVSIDSLAQALIVPIVYLAVTAIEGNFVTPLILGRRLELNPVVILLSVALWGFMWGVVGILLAVPLLVILKAFCDHVDGLNGLGEFLSGARQPIDSEEEETAGAPSSPG